MAAVEMSHAETPISATLEPMVRTLRRMERATRDQLPFRKESRRGRGEEGLVIGNWGERIGELEDWRLEIGD